MFLNISNHPLSQWSAEQLAAAKKYGEMEDIPFPETPTSITSSDISLMADTIVESIKKYDNPTVHIMGEMTLTYAIVRRLRAAGITCLASTTQRIKQQRDDGSFISEFVFQAFRPYE